MPAIIRKNTIADFYTKSQTWKFVVGLFISIQKDLIRIQISNRYSKPAFIYEILKTTAEKIDNDN